MSKSEYEVLHPLRRNGADSARGSTVQLEESEASSLVQGGVIRELPERKNKKSRKSEESAEE